MARKLGVWLIGAKGGVATSVTIGLVALRKGLATEQGLVTQLPPLAQLDLASWSDFTIGGHEIRETTFAAEAQQLVRNNHALDGELVARCKSDLDKLDKNVRPGTLVNVGRAIEKLAEPGLRKEREAPRAAIERIQADLRAFVREQKLDQLIVVNRLRPSLPPKSQNCRPAGKSSKNCSTSPSDFHSPPAPSTRLPRSIWGIPTSTSRHRWARRRSRCASWLSTGRRATWGTTARPAKHCSRASWPRCSPPAICR
jgi:hypothetical protein